MSINIGPKFRVGQLWRYRGRDGGEEHSRLLILKVEMVAGQNIVHVAVIGKGATDSSGHMPFAESAVRDSVTDLYNEGCSVAGYEDGYLYWKKQYESGEAGVYKIPVFEALAL